MSSVKISELNVIPAVTTDDYIPVVDSGSATTYRATFAALADWILSDVSASYALKSLLADLATSASYSKTSSFLEYHGVYNGSASYSISSSHAEKADTASYFSFNLSGLTADNATNALSASWASSSLSSSYSRYSLHSLSSSYASSSLSSSYSLTSSYAGTASWATNLVGGQSLPVGTIVDYAGATAPVDPSWALCDGSELDVTLYPVLWTTLGTTWGTASPGYVKLPDLRRRVTFMASGALSSPSTPFQLSGSVGNYGGSEAINQHWHHMGRSTEGFTGGYTSNNDYDVWWVGNTTLNTDVHFPQFSTPGGSYKGKANWSGDGSPGSQPDGLLPTISTGWCNGTSFAFSPSGSDMMPSYAIVNKIIKVS